METEIKSLLEDLLGAIGGGDAARVSRAMERLDEQLAAGATRLHPQLVHFLRNRSYAKALMFLRGDADIPTGACGGRAARP